MKIVEFRIDDEHKTCTATAVMSRNQVRRKSDSTAPVIIAPGIR